MRELRPALVALSAGLLALGLAPLACGGGNDSYMTLTINPQKVAADLGKSATVTARVVFQNAPVTDGTSVNFSATGGSFDPNDNTVTQTSADTTAGKATVKWYPPKDLGTYKISASYTDPYEAVQQAEASLSVVAPPPVDGSSFTFTCAANNVGLPTATSGAVSVPCTVTATDTDGNPVKVDTTRFHFMAETGAFQIDPDTHQLSWVVQPGQEPDDVDPAGDATTGEPRWVDQGQGGRIHNPRDGVVTLVVYTEGTPTGAQDAIQGEPYVDVNDNGQYDTTPTPEKYHDTDQNGSYTPAAGATGTTTIWRWYKLLLTGPTDAKATTAAGLDVWHTPGGSMNVPIPNGQSVHISLTLLDANLNPVASHPDSGIQDTVAITVNDQGALAVAPDTVPLATDYIGFAFNQTTGALDGRAVRATYVNVPDYGFTFTNTLQASDPSQLWSIISVDIQRTPDTGLSANSETIPLTTSPNGQLN